MEPTLPILTAGLAGGVVIAWLLNRLHRGHSARMSSDPFARQPDGSQHDVINVSAIRVAGIGGLGLIAVSVGLAFTFPRIGQSLMLAAVLGVAMAAGLILYRRRTGPMPSSGRQSGSNTTLAIDQPEPRASDTQPPPGQLRGVEATRS